jgi:transposase
MKPYSQDLRERVMAAFEAGKESQDIIVERFGIHPSTADKWWRRWRTTGNCAAWPPKSGPPRTLQNCAPFLRTEIKKQPDVTLAELCERVAQTQQVSASSSMMCRELKLLRLPRKKVALRQSARQCTRKTLAAQVQQTDRTGISPALASSEIP